MTGWRNPKDPLALPKPYRLRERARELKGKAEKLLKEADAFLAEAERLEAEQEQSGKTSEGISS
jgi:predicted nuclease with TOPRIM domain